MSGDYVRSGWRDSNGMNLLDGLFMLQSAEDYLFADRFASKPGSEYTPEFKAAIELIRERMFYTRQHISNIINAPALAAQAKDYAGFNDGKVA